MRRLLGLIIVLLGLLFVIDVAQKHLPTNFNFGSSNQATDNKLVKVVTEESITIDIAKKAGPSVVTIAGISTAPQEKYPKKIASVINYWASLLTAPRGLRFILLGI